MDRRHFMKFAAAGAASLTLPVGAALSPSDSQGRLARRGFYTKTWTAIDRTTGERLVRLQVSHSSHDDLNEEVFIKDCLSTDDGWFVSSSDLERVIPRQRIKPILKERFHDGHDLIVNPMQGDEVGQAIDLLPGYFPDDGTFACLDRIDSKDGSKVAFVLPIKMPSLERGVLEPYPSAVVIVVPEFCVRMHDEEKFLYFDDAICYPAGEARMGNHVYHSDRPWYEIPGTRVARLIRDWKVTPRYVMSRVKTGATVWLHQTNLPFNPRDEFPNSFPTPNEFFAMESWQGTPHVSLVHQIG